MIRKIRSETGDIVLAGEEDILKKHLKKRKKEKVHLNVNHLGETVLGEAEALSRFNEYCADMEKSYIKFLSIKVSGILSQMQPIAFEQNLQILKDRLKILYTAALMNNKFVNLDMEEYKNIEITARAFMETLDNPSLKNLTAGIAIQSYIPDSFTWQKKITEWAKKRVGHGGAPVKVRLVKGANLQMEQLESGLRGWPLPIYGSKVMVDAAFKAMIHYGIEKENIEAVNLGIASHNIFDCAYGYIMAEENGVTDKLMFEMLEGMADPIRKSVAKIMGTEVLLYAPIVLKKNFINAIAYLVRRMDENTSPDNFLSHSFDLRVGSSDWEFLRNQFLESYRLKNEVSFEPLRIQNRDGEDFPQKGTFYNGEFTNEPDTDWSLSKNRIWAEKIRKKWMKTKDDEPVEVPLVIDGVEIFDGREIQDTIDRSRPEEAIIVSSFRLGTEEDVERAVATARDDPDRWRDLSLIERHKIISAVAHELRLARGDLIGAMALNTGKVFVEGDVEVSEAIDFAEYYPLSMLTLQLLPGIECKPKGVGLVIPPWNFPTAIPAGGILGALSAGNTVIMKPSSDSVLVGYLLCQCFWRAGVSMNTLQFLPCRGPDVGSKLARHPGIDFVVFTGSTDTALQIIENRPDLYIAAETGGKNATIVTAMADYDSAISNIIHSAFSNSGQKCSATSLLVLTDDVFGDEIFKKQLVDAVKTYSAGSAWDFKNRTGPLINPLKNHLERTFKELEPEESWLIEPENIDGNPYLWKPCIKWNIKEGSYCHMTEFFGPMVSVMGARDLENAVEIVNSTGYGLTSGLESLDSGEQKYWKENIKAGNLYINRVTTGAIVLRQPFGGMGKSAYGSGIKAGGPNYTLQFLDYRESSAPSNDILEDEYPILKLIENIYDDLNGEEQSQLRDEYIKVELAVMSYLLNYEQEFSVERDYFKIDGQDNIFRYLPVGSVVVRVHENDSLFSVMARIAAVLITRNRLIVSIPLDLDNDVVSFLRSDFGKQWVDHGKILFQSDDDLGQLLPDVDLVRYGGPNRVPQIIFEEAAKTGFYIARVPVLSEGRIELLQYLKEQSISHNYHRYGNLGMRGLLKEKNSLKE